MNFQEYIRDTQEKYIIDHYNYLIEELTKLVEKAQEYDMQHVKKSYGGRKAARNMTAEQRRERAIKAAQARFKK